MRLPVASLSMQVARLSIVLGVAASCTARSEAGFADLTPSTIKLFTNSLPANGIARARIGLRLAQDPGGAVVGMQIQVTADGEGNIITQPERTGDDGDATSSIASTVPGTKTVSAAVLLD